MCQQETIMMTRTEYNNIDNDELQYIKGKRVKIVRDNSQKGESKTSPNQDFWE